jgi:uncharacterized protein (DUF2252 family)
MSQEKPLALKYVPQEELLAQGKALRKRVQRSLHGVWTPPAKRIDPTAFVLESDKGRLRDLIPVRHGRMLASPFTFYRGSAGFMAADLAKTPATGIRVQACGDCHILNFGGFATPERRLIFAINDLDETLPAPWEWDVKRLAASFVIASRSNGFREADARDAVLACVCSYRERMAEYAKMTALEVWYERMDIKDLIPTVRDEAAMKRFRKNVAKARAHSIVEDLFPKLVRANRGKPSIRQEPPLIYHPKKKGLAVDEKPVQMAFAAYRDTLPEDRRVLLDRYRLIDAAIKVVGIGSVGTACWVLLLMAGPDDVLFLQVKEARPSVLEEYAGKSRYANNGQRVVQGQKLMQSASDLFLGWTQGVAGRHFYVRQLRDMKVKPMVELFTPTTMVQFAEFCGWATAHGHARSGQPALISGYLGNSDKFDQAIADFSAAYADQNEKDHAAFARAARQGRFEVELVSQ